MTDKRIGFEVRRLSNAIKSHREQHHQSLECQNISMMQHWIIRFLAEHKDADVYQKDLEKRFHIGKSTLTQMLHVMEKNDLVIRKPSMKDARCKRLVLTKQAEDIHEEVKRDIDQFEAQMRQGIDEEELDIFFKVLNKMVENANGTEPDKEFPPEAELMRKE